MKITGINEDGISWIALCPKCDKIPLAWDTCQKQKCPVECDELGRAWMNRVHGQPLPPITENEQ